MYIERLHLKTNIYILVLQLIALNEMMEKKSLNRTHEINKKKEENGL